MPKAVQMCSNKDTTSDTAAPVGNTTIGIFKIHLVFVEGKKLD